MIPFPKIHFSAKDLCQILKMKSTNIEKLFPKFISNSQFIGFLSRLNFMIHMGCLFQINRAKKFSKTLTQNRDAKLILHNND